MYCKKCGKRIDDDARYCKECGADQFESTNNMLSDGADENKTLIKETEKNSSKWKTIIPLIICVAIIGIMIGVLKHSSDSTDSSEDKKATGNFNVTEQNTNNEQDLYLTDTLEADGWSITPYLIWMGYDDILEKNVLNCYCDITNVDSENKTFYGSDIEVVNGGLVENGFCDQYDGQTLQAGTSFSTVLNFYFPNNSNTQDYGMSMEMGGKKLLLAAKPQFKEEYNSLEGLYKSDSHMQLLFIKLSEGTYRLFHYNPRSGLEITTVYLEDDNSYQENAMRYMWIPEEKTIYPMDGERIETDSYCFFKQNMELQETEGTKEIEKGKEVYGSFSGLSLAVEQDGKKAHITVYAILGGEESEVYYKGTVKLNHGTENAEWLEYDEGYEKGKRIKLCYPNEDESTIYLYEADSEEPLEFMKQ